MSWMRLRLRESEAGPCTRIETGVRPIGAAVCASAQTIRSQGPRLRHAFYAGKIMNLMLGLLVGALMGWAAFALFRFNANRSLSTSLLLGSVAGGVGSHLAFMIRSAPSVDGALSVFALITAAATAGACLIIASMFASR